MSNPVPSALALTVPADGATLIASRDRNNDTAEQTAVNALITCLSGGVSGQILQAVDSSHVDWNGGVYQAYTPTWTAAGTAPAIGNATVFARYARLGKLVHANGQIQFGSTSTFGTGIYSFSLPVTSGSVAMTGMSAFSHNATGAFGIGETSPGTTTTFVITYPATWLGTATQIGQLAPWTWAANDIIQWNILYEAA